jgi:hypothetical protein
VNITAQDEIAEYVAAVRAALADLPEVTRDELLEDLPEHLAEVRAEGAGTLADRLGAPELYAAELRAAAGFVGGFPDPPRSGWVTINELHAGVTGALDNVMRVLGRADVKTGPLIGYARASEFLLLLRPAWWVLRGYLVAMAVAVMLDNSTGNLGLLPRIGGSDIIAILLLAAAIGGSILLGKRGTRLSRWPRWSLYSATTLLVIFGLAGFSTADNSVRSPGFNGVGSYQDAQNYTDVDDTEPNDNVSDLFVYDAQGRLVKGARVFDQDGMPVQLGSGWCTDPETGDSHRSRNMGYPYCPENEPFGSPSPSVSPSPSGVGGR